MAIVNFLSGSPGPTGPTGPIAEQYQTTLAMLAWKSTSGRSQGFNLESYSFVSRDGIDPKSVVKHSPKDGYIESPSFELNTSYVLSLDNLSKVSAKNYKQTIARWFKDNNATGHFEGVTQYLSNSNAVDKGSGLVGIPCLNHGYTGGTKITIRGTSNYNGTYTVHSSSSENEIVIEATYVSETFSGNETVNQRVTLGPGKDNENVEVGMLVQFLSDYRFIKSITNYGDGTGEVELSDVYDTETIVGIYNVECSNGLTRLASCRISDRTWYERCTFNKLPHPREDFAMVFDSDNNCIWVYGGKRSSTKYTDLWKYSFSTSSWTLMNPSGGPPTNSYQLSMIRDPVNNDLLIFGGRNVADAVTNELWKYSITSNSWTKLNPSGTITARCYHTAVYDPVNATMLVYGGYTGSANVTDQLWRYTIATNTWSQITYSGTVTSRRSHTAVYEGGSVHSMWIWGGYTSGNVQELIRYDIAANTMSTITQTNPPSSRSNHCAVLHSATRRMYVFGSGSSTDNSIYELNLNTYVWNTVSISGSFVCDGRARFGMILKENNIYVFGGLEYSGTISYDIVSSSFWTFSLQSKTWTNLIPIQRWITTFCVIGSSNIAIQLGGEPGIEYNHVLKDYWKVNLDTFQWTRIFTSLSSNIAKEMAFCYDYDSNCIWIYGGVTSGSASRTSNLMKLSMSDLSLTLITPGGNSPEVRDSCGMFYDSLKKLVYIVSGNGLSDNYYYTIYAYSKEGNVWIRMMYSNPDSFNNEKYGFSGGFDPVTRCYYFIGGSPSSIGEMWKYDVDRNVLMRIYPSGQVPYRRFQAVSFFRPQDRSIYIFGGYDLQTSTQNNDLYRYAIDENRFYQVSTSGNLPPACEAFGSYDETLDTMYISGLRCNNEQIVFPNSVYELRLSKFVPYSKIATIVTNNTHSINVSSWKSINKVIPTQSTPSGSFIFHAVSFDEKSTFKILKLGSEISMDLSSVTNKGSGKVGFPATGHGLSAGDRIRVYGTVNYNGNYTVDSGTSANEIVVQATYVPEVLTLSSKCRTVDWYSIARNYQNVWQYRTSAGNWENASSNDVNTALAQAFSVSQNRMSGDELSNISQWEWNNSGGFQSGTTLQLDFAIGLKSESSNVPLFSSYLISYDSASSNLLYLSPTWTASQNDPTKAYCVLDVEALDPISVNTDLKVWVSIDNGQNYDQITDFSVFYSSGSRFYIRGVRNNLTQRSDKRIKLKITSHNNKRVRIYHAALEVRHS